MTNREPLGHLVTVPLRQVWAHEAHDFTPWMLANPKELGDVLGMDLELSKAEHPVGGFTLDLVGVDTATGERVIVENQLQVSDHGHLGQLLTYAGGTDAGNIVWVASAFRDEHRAALDWLNARTDEDTSFFAVEVSAVRIGSSPPAPLLKLVAAPNDWNKVVKKSTSQGGERAALYREFWGTFLERLHEDRPSWTRATKPANTNWITCPSGTSGVFFGSNFRPEGLCTEILFEGPPAETNSARFQALMSHKEDVEAMFGAGLQWEDLAGVKRCRVATYRSGSSIEDRSSWPEFMDWFIDSQDRLRSAYTAYGAGTSTR